MRLTLLAALGFAATLVVPPDASACTPAFPEVSPYPSNGSSYPANAALYLGGDRYDLYGLDLDDIEVLVDGASARLVSAEGLTAGVPELSFKPPWFALVSPEPRPGQTVRLRGLRCPLGESGGSSEECAGDELTYTATAPDATAPAAPEPVYAVERYNGCESYWEYIAYLAPPAESAIAAPVMYLFEGFADATLTEQTFTVGQFAAQTQGRVRLSPAPRDVGCVRARAFDLAGHEAAAASLVCSLPAVPPEPEPESKGDGEEGGRARRPEMRLEDDGSCRLAGGVGARATPWAGPLAAAALLIGGLRRRRPASRRPTPGAQKSNATS